MVSVSASLLAEFTINVPDEPETVMQDLREIGPHTMFAPPRIWENISSTVQMKIMDTTPFKRAMYNLCMPVGYRVADLKFNKQPVLWGWATVSRFAHWALFRGLT